jgi:hypothetical protein
MVTRIEILKQAQQDLFKGDYQWLNPKRCLAGYITRALLPDSEGDEWLNPSKASLFTLFSPDELRCFSELCKVPKSLHEAQGTKAYNSKLLAFNLVNRLIKELDDE